MSHSRRKSSCAPWRARSPHRAARSSRAGSSRPGAPPGMRSSRSCGAMSPRRRLKTRASRPEETPMHTNIDVLVVGAGFSGAVMAERLADAGLQVLVIDKRPHIGGNAYDRLDGHGVLVHPYGPHIFHTNAERIFDYLSNFTEWRPYEHRVLARVDGKYLPMPINRTTINELYGLSMSTDKEGERFLEERGEPVDHIRTSEDVVVAKVGRELYEKFFRGYTRKQWQRDPS